MDNNARDKSREQVQIMEQTFKVTIKTFSVISSSINIVFSHL